MLQVDKLHQYYTPLQRDPRTGVAAAAHLAGLVIKMLDGIQAPLQRITHAVRFAGGQALCIGQVLDQRAAVVIADLQVVHGLHSGDGHQPAFRRFALVADSA